MLKDTFDYVKDHLKHFGFYPYDVAIFKDNEDIEDIQEYPDYLKLSTIKQKKELNNIINNYPKYRS